MREASGARQRQVDPDLAYLRRDGSSPTSVPPRPSMMFFEIGRPRPVPARRVVKYGSKICAMSSGEMPTPRSWMVTVACVPASLVRISTGAASGSQPEPRDGPAAAVGPRGGQRHRVHRMARIRQQVDKGGPQPFGIGVAVGGMRVVEVEPHLVARRARPRRRRRGAADLVADRASARSNRIGRAKSSTSLTMRLRRVVSSSMSATASRHSDARGRVPAQDRQRRLDDHQRVTDFVRDDGRQPAERRQPLLLRRLLLEPLDRLRHRVERRGQEPRILVIPGPALERDPARQVAGGRHFAHRPRDGVRAAASWCAQRRNSPASPRCTVTRAQPIRPLRMVLRKRRRSVRERRISATGAPGSAAGRHRCRRSGRARARNSSSSR